MSLSCLKDIPPSLSHSESPFEGEKRQISAIVSRKIVLTIMRVRCRLRIMYVVYLFITSVKETRAPPLLSISCGLFNLSSCNHST